MKYFKLQEFKCRCCGQLPQPENIEALVINVLDPAREALGRPIYVSSGYRCPKHNTAVGGVTNSQHMRCEAADISVEGSGMRVEGQQELMKLARIIVTQGRFAQLILYPTFLHVTYKRPSAGSGSDPNRHRVLRKVPSGYAIVSNL